MAGHSVFYDPDLNQYHVTPQVQEHQLSKWRALSFFGLGLVVTALPLAAYSSSASSSLWLVPQASTSVTQVPLLQGQVVAVSRPTAPQGTTRYALPGQHVSTQQLSATAAAPVASETRSGLLPPERYIASNQFKVRDGAQAQFEARWAKRKSRLALLPGFRFFTLMRRVTPPGTPEYTDDYNYVSLTVWQDKDAFTAWRTGDAFKEAHGGTDLFSFFKMITTSLLQTKGPPKPAFYEALLPVAAPANPTPTVDGWRSVEANGVDLLKGECFVAMNRFSVEPGQESAFEQRWAQRKSSLEGQPGFKGFWLSRADTPLEDGCNYVAMTVWEDQNTFFQWRDANDAKSKNGPQPGEKPEMLTAWPKAVFYEGVLMLESQAGI